MSSSTGSDSTQPISGVIPAIVTPFNEAGSIDFGSLEKQANYLANHGISGVFVAGTTGEGYELTTQEKLEAFRCVKDTVSPNLKLFAACIQPTTQLVISEMRAFEPFAPDYLVAVTPFYGAKSQDTIIAHYTALADAAFAPVILYDIPGRTANKINMETVGVLARNPSIVAIKDSSGDFIGFSQNILKPDFESYSSGFRFIQGTDSLDAPSLLVGAHALVTGMGNVWIEPYVEMFNACRDGDSTLVLSCQRKINNLLELIKLAGGIDISAIKASCEILGRTERWMRSPGSTLPQEKLPVLEESLRSLGIDQ